MKKLLEPPQLIGYVVLFILLIFNKPLSNFFGNIFSYSLNTTTDVNSGNRPCTSNGAKSFAKKRINSTIGKVYFLDQWNSSSNSWTFKGAAYSKNYSKDVDIWVTISCSGGSYDVSNIDVDI